MVPRNSRNPPRNEPRNENIRKKSSFSFCSNFERFGISEVRGPRQGLGHGARMNQDSVMRDFDDARFGEARVRGETIRLVEKYVSRGVNALQRIAKPP